MQRDEQLLLLMVRDLISRQACEWWSQFRAKGRLKPIWANEVWRPSGSPLLSALQLVVILGPRRKDWGQIQSQEEENTKMVLEKWSLIPDQAMPEAWPRWALLRALKTPMPSNFPLTQLKPKPGWPLTSEIMSCSDLIPESNPCPRQIWTYGPQVPLSPEVWKCIYALTFHNPKDPYNLPLCPL